MEHLKDKWVGINFDNKDRLEVYASDEGSSLLNRDINYNSNILYHRPQDRSINVPFVAVQTVLYLSENIILLYKRCRLVGG